MFIYSENIYTPEGIRKGYIKIKDKKITSIQEKININENIGEEILDYKDCYVIPGFIDNHIHGWGTGSFWKDGTVEAIYNMKKDLVKEGTT